MWLINLQNRIGSFLLDGWGPSVQDVLNGGQQAMQDGGSLGEAGSKVDSIGGGAYHIVYKGAIYLAIIALVFVGIRFLFSNGANRQENKTNMLYTILGVIFIAAAVSIVIFVSTIGSGLLPN